MAEVILYASIASRSIAAYWVLEELGMPYRVVDVDLKVQWRQGEEPVAS